MSEDLVNPPNKGARFNASQWLIPDGSQKGLSTIVCARTGAGKTELIKRFLYDGYKDPAAAYHRTIFISPKQEDILGAPVVSDHRALQKALEKNSIVSYHPIDPEYYDEDVDGVIETVFNLKDEIPTIKDDDGVERELSYHIVIDDCQILNGFDSRRTPSSSVKKLIIAGRGKRVKSTLIVHRFGALPRITNSNCSDLVALNVSSIDMDITKRLFGIDFEPIMDDLVDYRWVYVDLLQNNPTPIKYAPVTLVGQ